MVLFCSWALWAGVHTYAQTAPGKKPEVPLRLEISSARRVYAKRTPIPVRVQISNISSRDVLIGRDLWGNGSPSRVTLFASARDGHPLGSVVSFADGFPVEDHTKEVLRWCISLRPGYSYSATTTLQNFIASSDLKPGTYTIRAGYSSGGMDADLYFNPLLSFPEELAKLKPESWSGELTSNEITITIAKAR